ncbi:DUF5133 domain-containing protein, partial [Streptomyces albidoflavus]
MLMAHPAVLRDLIGQYETLRALNAQDGGEEAQRRLADVSYTLCVVTGTRDADAAPVPSPCSASSPSCSAASPAGPTHGPPPSP